MKLFVRKALMFFWVIMGIAFMNCPSYATDVSGIIDTDTTWDLAGSPYIVTGGVLVESDATLTIEAGVQVLFDGFYHLIVKGNIRALGTQGNEILFTSNLNPQQLSDWGGFQLENNLGSEISGIILEFSNYGILIEGGSGNKINNNLFKYISGYALSIYNSDNLSAHNNYIYKCAVNSGGTSAVIMDYRASVIFRDNTVENAWRGIKSDSSSHIINNNNFIGQSEYFVFCSSSGGVIDGRYNYWGPETTSEMELEGAASNIEKIYDFYDFPTYGRVDYAEWLNAPNPDAYPWMGTTPVNQSPVAKTGPDQAVFDTVTLDGSASYDPDGEVVSYDWLLVYRGDSPDLITSGINPTITDLYSGFYDVTLSVTDDDGATSTDTSVVATAGPCVCTASTMHIESIIAGTVRGSKGQSFGEVIVTVYDDYGKPVVEADVTGIFTGDFNETGRGVTDGNGVAVIHTALEFKKPLYDFCVESVVKDLLTYDDVETCVNNYN